MRFRRRKPFRVSLFAKFAVCIILVGIFPVGLVVTVIYNHMVDTYLERLRMTYEEALSYVSYAIEARLDSYNELSKFCYYYDYSSAGSFDYDYKKYDNLRLILTGEAFPEEGNPSKRIRQEVELFLYYLNKTDANIEATHFFYAPEGEDPTFFHCGNYNNQIFDDATFSQELSIEDLERKSKRMLVCPTHNFSYTRFTDGTRQVFTVGRNYFDLTRVIGKERYVGTLFIDLNLSEFDRVFANLKLSPDITLYVVDDAGNCCFSTNGTLTGHNLHQDGIDYDVPPQEGMLLSQKIGDYGLTAWLRLSGIPIAEINRIRDLMYLCLLLSLTALFIGSVFFSRRLTQPIRAIMSEMTKVETGQFKEQIPVTSHDELGELTARFNRMTVQLENYTNQVYVARIQQTEAELTALKSQIYPHFLYNTLEVIRMTAVNHQDEMIGRMVEALSDQIRYLIGTASDVVPLRNEIDILQKYIYLVNCRFDNKVEFQFSCDDLLDIEIPKLVLQPLVENAFIHGVRPMKGRGCIRLLAQRSGTHVELTVLDNGVGMTPETLDSIKALLSSDQPGQKHDYQWERIGLKNVHDRLRYLYGEGFGVDLFSTPGMGTVIKVTIPRNLKGDTNGEGE